MPKLPVIERACVYLGVDPGKAGGLAALRVTTYQRGAELVGIETAPTVTRMPSTEVDLWHLLAELAALNDPKVVHRLAIIERVGGYVTGSGRPIRCKACGTTTWVPGQPGSYMFRFGASYGALRMALVGRGIPFEDVTPRAWQKLLGISPRAKNEPKTRFKNRLKARAQELFPDLGRQITLSTCDALLLAEYAKRIEGKRS